MVRLRGWFASAAIVALAIGIVIVTGYFFAPVASSLWLLALVSLGAGILISGVLTRLNARRMRWRTGRAIVFAMAAVLAPFAALAVWVASVPLPHANPPSPDPRGEPEMVSLPTGSRLATWMLPGEGSQRRTPVIFLHGGPGFFAKKRDLVMGAPFRAVGFNTFFYDQAGSGASGDLPVADYTMVRQVADLDALRDRLGADRVILWGESWGATIAARYALVHPERVAAAVFSSPGEYPGMAEVAFDYSGVRHNKEPSRPPQSMILYMLLTRAPQLAESWMDQRTARGVSTAMSNATLDQPGPRCKSAPWAKHSRSATSSSSVYTLRRLVLDEFGQPAPPRHRFDVPALIVRGACDFIPKTVAHRYAEAFPQAKMVAVPQAGHSLLDHEKDFERAAASFAREQLRLIP